MKTKGWPVLTISGGEIVADSKIVFDRFHISKHMNQALDDVRKHENTRLRKSGNDILTGTKYIWLYAGENLLDLKPPWTVWKVVLDRDKHTLENIYCMCFKPCGEPGTLFRPWYIGQHNTMFLTSYSGRFCM